MWQIFKQTLKDRWLIVLIYIIAACGFLLMYTAIYPSFQNQQIQFDDILKSMPEGFSKAFNLQDYNLSVFESYISSEEFSFMWPLLLLILSISFAGGIFAGEIEKGTIEVLLSQPISRKKLYLSRYLAGLASVAGFCIITIAMTVIIAKIFSISIKIGHYPGMLLIGLLFGWAVFSIAACLSALFSEKGKVYFITAGILVLMYVLNIVAGLKSNLIRLQDFSFFHYYNPTDALLKNHINPVGIWVFLLTVIFFAILGLIIFDRRDIAT